MNIHEYQGKILFKQAGVKVQDGVHCKTIDDALNAYDSLDSKVVAVKSQIHAGGRGKGTLYDQETNICFCFIQSFRNCVKDRYFLVW